MIITRMLKVYFVSSTAELLNPYLSHIFHMYLTYDLLHFYHSGSLACQQLHYLLGRTHPHNLRKHLYTIFFRDLKLCLGNPGLFSWILGYWSVLASPQASGWDCSTSSHSSSLPTPFLSLKTRGHFNDHKGLTVL